MIDKKHIKVFLYSDDVIFLDSKSHKQAANPTKGPGLSGGVKAHFTLPQMHTTEKKAVSLIKGHTHEEPATDGSGSSAPVTQTSKGRTGEYLRSSNGQPKEGPEQEKIKTTNPSSGMQTSKGLSEDDSIKDKAKAYIKRKKEEQAAVIRSSLGEKLLTYDAINMANRRKMVAPYLQSEAGLQDEGLENGGDFLSTGDGRAARMFLRVNLQRKMTLSFSFDPQRKICTFCPANPNHTVLGAATVDGRPRVAREVIMLGD